MGCNFKRVWLAAWLIPWLANAGAEAAEPAISYSTKNKVAAAHMVWRQHYLTGADITQRRKHADGAGDSMRGMAVDSHDGVVATGYFFTGGGFAAVTIKYNREGRLLWAAKSEGAYNEAGYGVALDSQDNVFVAGLTSNGTNDDFLILKYDAAGKEVWRKTYDSGGEDWARGVAVDRQGGVYVTGTTCGKTQDWVACKYDSAGGLVWRHSAPGYGAAVAVGGDRIFSAGDEGGSLRAFDSAGRLLWEKKSQLPNKDWGWGATLAVAADGQGNAYVAGMASARATNDQDAFLVKYRPDGQMVWRRTYHDYGNDFGYAVAVDAQEHPYLAIDACLVKCDVEGRCTWSRRLDGNASALACDREGCVYLGTVASNRATKSYDLVIMKLRKE